MTSDEIRQRVITVIANSVGVNRQSITENSCTGDPPEWDSLAHMEILVELEREYPGLSAAMPDIGLCETVSDFEQLVKGFVTQGDSTD